MSPKQVRSRHPPKTADEFDRADRASRILITESLTDFCRAVILEKADDLLAKKARSSYRNLQELPSAKVAAGSDGHS